MASYIAPAVITAAFLLVAVFFLVQGQIVVAIAFGLIAAVGVAELYATAEHNRYMRRFGG